MDYNLDLYRVFLAVAKAGSFSRAAEALFITQPAVSHSIRQLEEKLGGPLFFRTSRGAKLTVEGEVLLRYIGQAFQLIAEAEHRLTEMHQLLSGVVHIGANDTLCKHVLLPYLEAFHKEYPDVKLHVTNRTSQETIKLLKEGAIDFGIVNLPVDDAQLSIRRWKPLHDIFVAGARYSHLQGQTMTPAELAAYPIILLERDSSMRKYADRYFQAHQVRITPEFELGSLDLLIQFAKTGLGISCVTGQFAAEELASGELFELRLEPAIPPRHIGIVTLKDVPLSFAAQTMLELCLQS
ncbi:LysR family transcriptional regulator [Paenibacillus doosanensis]|uniref:LysR family transcriptional regulator n=1 Tax=Paenibacillus doosanensis TaxID=1229154 RepID=UPI00218035DA|nr:LysR family transcriptional regulator [Paenibacillus doosanensis]MCS7462267.1 LysR family transcriptional regulator [Paenibacillus doosanensis]